MLEGCLTAAARGGHTAVARLILQSDSLRQEVQIAVDEEILYTIRASGDVDMWQLMNMGTSDEVRFRPPFFYSPAERAAKKLLDEKEAALMRMQDELDELRGELHDRDDCAAARWLRP